ncbi:MAG: aldo/keto reductase [Thermoanaerobaculia bacterium]
MAHSSGGEQAAASPPPLPRAIPISGEVLPPVGMGTWQTFDVSPSATRRRPLEGVLRRFVEKGGRFIDSSPMYGRSEEMVGNLCATLGEADFFLATKVWTRGRRAGIEQMERSASLLRKSPTT